MNRQSNTLIHIHNNCNRFNKTGIYIFVQKCMIQNFRFESNFGLFVVKNMLF